MAFVGGGIVGQFSRRYGPKYVITVGLTLEALGIWLYVAAFSPTTTFLSLLPALVLHGIGIGFATSQLTNVVLSDIPPQKAGSASGAAGMVRQVGTALGIALIGAIFVSQAAGHVRHDLRQATDIPPAVQQSVVAGVSDHVGGGASAAAGDTPVGKHVEQIVSDAVARAAQPAVAFAGVVVTAGAVISLLVPNIPAEHERPGGVGEPWAEAEAEAPRDEDPDPEEEVEPSPA
jgi:nitrate/nitrite transporter NarK